MWNFVNQTNFVNVQFGRFVLACLKDVFILSLGERAKQRYLAWQDNIIFKTNLELSSWPEKKWLFENKE